MPDVTVLLPLATAIRRDLIESQQCRFVGDPSEVDRIIDTRVRPLVEALSDARRLLDCVDFEAVEDVAALQRIDAALKAAGVKSR